MTIIVDYLTNFSNTVAAMSVKKRKYGYVVRRKNTKSYLAKNGSFLAVLGEQADTLNSERVHFFLKCPSKGTYPAARYVIRQAAQEGTSVYLFNHSYKEAATFNDDIL